MLPPSVSGLRWSSSGNSPASMITASPMRSSAWPMRPSGMTIGSPSSSRAEHLGVPLDRGGGIVRREVRRERVQAGGRVLADFGHRVVVPLGSGRARRDNAAAQRGCERRAGCERDVRLAQRVERVSRHRIHLARRRLGTRCGRGRAAPRSRARCGRGGRRPRAPRGRRGSAASSAARWCGPSSASTSRVRARSKRSSTSVGLDRSSGSERRLRVLACLAPPVVDELVPGDADEPRDGEVRHRVALDGLHRGEEGLGGEVLGDGSRCRPGRAGSRTPAGARGRTSRAAPFPGRRSGCSRPLTHADHRSGGPRSDGLAREFLGDPRRRASRRVRSGPTGEVADGRTVRISLVAAVMTVCDGACGGGVQGPVEGRLRRAGRRDLQELRTPSSSSLISHVAGEPDAGRDPAASTSTS